MRIIIFLKLESVNGKNSGKFIKMEKIDGLIVILCIYYLRSKREMTLMSAKIQKWGNSVGVRIPKTIMEKANLSINSEIEIEYKNQKIIIFAKKKNIQLKDLLSQITKNNLHTENNYIKAGKEIW